MRCTIISRAGQVLAYGRLFIYQQEDGELRLNLETDGGRLLEGGLMSEDGDMAEAAQTLSEQFFDVWGMSDLTLNILCASQANDTSARLNPSAEMDMSLL